MTCPLGNGTQELLVAYSSRKLDIARMAVLEQHLESCAGCRDFVRGQRAVWEALDVWEPAPISADFNRRLYQRIEEQVSWWDRLMQPFRPLAFHKGVSLAAAACVVLAVGLMIDQTAAPPQAPARNDAVAEVDGLQPEQVVKALDEMEAMSQFNRLMKPETPEAKM